MGIDLVKRGRIVNKHKKDTRSKNLYHHLLVKLFKFLSRRTDSKFTKTVLRRLVSSRVNRPPLSLTKLVKHLGANKDREAKKHFGAAGVPGSHAKPYCRKGSERRT